MIREAISNLDLEIEVERVVSNWNIIAVVGQPPSIEVEGAGFSCFQFFKSEHIIH